VAVGVARPGGTNEAFAVQSTGGAWQTLAVPALPAGSALLGVALDAGGNALLVGGTPSVHPIIVDERANWSASILTASGYLNAVAAGDGSALLAVGVASGGLAARSVGPGVWVTDQAGFTTAAEKGLVDVSFAAGSYIACGWDDATLAPVLRRYDGNSWTEIPGPGLGGTPGIRAEHRAIWLGSDGGFWLGGTVIDSSGGSDRLTARLAARSSGGDWFDIVLPDAPSLEAVNDIRRAADGSLYLACGETTARVLRWDGTSWQDEQPAIPGQFLALAEDATGAIYAAGWRLDAQGQERPLLRRRLSS
jgi:hypothetical protein